jgi:hypothetical protein
MIENIMTKKFDEGKLKKNPQDILDYRYIYFALSSLVIKIDN